MQHFKEMSLPFFLKELFSDSLGCGLSPTHWTCHWFFIGHGIWKSLRNIFCLVYRSILPPCGITWPGKPTEDRAPSLQPSPYPCSWDMLLPPSLEKRMGLRDYTEKKRTQFKTFRVTLSTAKLRAQSSSCTVKTEIMFTVSRKILWISTRWDKGI